MIITPKSHTAAITGTPKTTASRIACQRPGNHEAELAKELERCRRKSLIEIIDHILWELAKALEAMDGTESDPRTNSKLIGKTA
jgi:hypothetical protein